MTQYRVNKLFKDGIKEITTVAVRDNETLAQVLVEKKIVRGDALIVHGRGVAKKLAAVRAQGQTFLLDII